MSERKENAVASRRDFLKTTAVAGTAAVAGLSFVPSVHAAGSDTIKVGIVGCGGRGSGAARNVLHSSKNVQIVAIGDVFKAKTDNLRKTLQNAVQKDAKIKELMNSINLPEEHCFHGLDAYQKVINSDANYIILATPPGFRPTHIQAVVAAKKNLFTEKPVGVDGPGIRKVLEAYEKAKEHGLYVVAGTQRRHQLGYLETLKRIAGGDIGDITSMRCYWNNSHNIWFRKREELKNLGVEDSDLAYQLNNWYHFVWTCGDHIVEQHVHNLDVCNWAMNGHPKRCVGMGGRGSRPVGDPKVVGHIFDNFSIDFEYDNGVHMLSTCRQIDGGDANVTEALVGTKGTCQVNAYTVNGKRLMTRQQDKDAADPYVQEHTDLIACIRSSKPINELKTVAESTMTAIMGRMSSYTGRPLTWEQALASKEVTMPANLSWNMSLPVPTVAIPGKTAFV